MKIVINFKFSKKYVLKNEDLEKIFNLHKNYIKYELENSYLKKYGLNLPENTLTFNSIDFNENINEETTNNLINFNFRNKPEEKLLNFVIDNEEHYNEDYLTKINIKFEI